MINYQRTVINKNNINSNLNRMENNRGIETDGLEVNQTIQAPSYFELFNIVNESRSQIVRLDENASSCSISVAADASSARSFNDFRIVPDLNQTVH